MVYYSEVSVGLGLSAGALGFILNYSHLLNSLLSLEFLALMVYWWVSMNSSFSGKDLFFSLFYLVMVVCEGVLGLSLLISGAYSHGADYMKSYNSLGC